MSKKCKYYITNIGISFAILTLVFGLSVILQEVLAIGENITMLFVFGVFLISVFTEGYLFAILSAFISVIAVNFAFTFPYFAFNFTIPENFMSALIMIAISLMTSALTTKLKAWQALKAEGEKERMRANLLRAVSHDLRTPLTGICGSSRLMLESGDGLTEEQKHAMLTGILEDAEWLTRLVENLLSVTRLDGENVSLYKTPTALDELIDSTVQKFQRRYPDAPLQVSLPDEVLLVPMDALLIEQVLLNLLENAVCHAKGMTRLSLLVREEGGMVAFTVEDDGCGVDEEKIGRILQGGSVSFDEGADMQNRHAGIGLSVCSTIIRVHGARIFVKNLPNGGASFTFKIGKTLLPKTEDIENVE